MRFVLAIAMCLVGSRVGAEENAPAPNPAPKRMEAPAANAAVAPTPAAGKKQGTQAERAQKPAPAGGAASVVTAKPAAAKPATAKPAAAKPATGSPRDKAPAGKVVTLDVAPVSGERQRPKASYVLQPNVKAVREAANSITEEHVESAQHR